MRARLFVLLVAFISLSVVSVAELFPGIPVYKSGDDVMVGPVNVTAATNYDISMWASNRADRYIDLNTNIIKNCGTIGMYTNPVTFSYTNKDLYISSSSVVIKVVNFNRFSLRGSNGLATNVTVGASTLTYSDGFLVTVE